MILNDRFHIIHIPKTGGKSVYQALAHLDQKSPKTLRNQIARGIGVTLPWRAARLRRHDDVALSHRFARGIDVPIVAVVRNPYDHAISHYRHLQTQNKNRTYAYKAVDLDLAAFLQWRAKGDPRSGFRKHINRRFAQMPSQYSFLSIDGELRASHIMRLETLNTDFAAFCAKFGLGDLVLPKINTNTSAAPTTLDPQSIALINQIYDPDFEAFGYPRRSV